VACGDAVVEAGIVGVWRTRSRAGCGAGYLVLGEVGVILELNVASPSSRTRQRVASRSRSPGAVVDVAGHGPGSRPNRRRVGQPARSSARPPRRICCSRRGPQDRRLAPPDPARTGNGGFPSRRACHAGCRGGAGRAELCQHHRRVVAPRLAGATARGPVAAGSGRVPGADGPGQPRQAVDRDAHAAHLGHPAGADAQRDRVPGTDPGSPPATVQRQW
jgi:hypothetical protein